MPYKAKVKTVDGEKEQVFDTLEKAVAWIESERDNMEDSCSLERLDRKEK